MAPIRFASVFLTAVVFSSALAWDVQQDCESWGDSSSCRTVDTSMIQLQLGQASTAAALSSCGLKFIKFKSGTGHNNKRFSGLYVKDASGTILENGCEHTTALLNGNRGPPWSNPACQSVGTSCTDWKFTFGGSYHFEDYNWANNEEMATNKPGDGSLGWNGICGGVAMYSSGSYTIEFPTIQQISAYAAEGITTGENLYVDTWTIEGSVDGTTWFQLDDRLSGVAGMSPTNTFTGWLPISSVAGCQAAAATPAPGAPAPGPAPVAGAKGDPHLVNVRGQRFDLFQPGSHVLLQIPMGAARGDALLAVVAEARQIGKACSDMYFQSLNVTGQWADGVRKGGLQFSADAPAEHSGTGWMPFQSVDLKVVFGHTVEGVRYLNMFARHLGRAKHSVGGLLGEDDHTEVAARSERCKHSISLFQGSDDELNVKSSGLSRAEATLL